MGARCSAKDKRRLLKDNARGGGWRRDGLNSAKFEIVGGEEKPLPFSPDDGPTGGDKNHGGDVPTLSSSSSSSSSSSCLRGVHVVVRLRASIDDELTCVECGESKPPSGFASHQYRRAMFWVKRGGGGGGGDSCGGDHEPCHWDNRGVSLPDDDDDAVDDVNAAGAVDGEGSGDGGVEEGTPPSAVADRSSKEWKHSARCLTCVEKDPRVVEDRRCKARNQTDVARMTCSECQEAFSSRTKLFKHLETSGHGGERA